jgi:nucleotide-binding universal stress UspA family protein
MLNCILVPLDQSPVAESVVPLVADMARGGKGTVRLLHVAPTPQNIVGADGRVVAYADQEMQRLGAEAMDYLRTIEVRFEGVPVECVARFGDAVTEILLEADACKADLIAMNTTGRSGFRRAILGSVADQVFRRAKAPVMLFSPAR